MPPQWTCPKCQQQNSTEVRFCPHCGTVNPAAPVLPGGVVQPRLNNRRLWLVGIGLWLLGCGVLAVGGGIWWSQRQPAVEIAAPLTPAPTAGSVITPPPTPEKSLPSPTPPPAVVTVEVTAETAGDQVDNINAADTTGDTLALPSATPAPEGVILFLSSRDHTRTEAEIRDHSGAHDLELYAMRPDGSQQTRLSDGTLKLTNYPPPPLTSYFVDGQIVIGTRIFDLKTRQVAAELTTTQVVDGHPIEFSGGSSDFVALQPVWSHAGAIAFFGGASSKGFNLYYLENINGTVKQLTVAPDEAWGDGFPAWSPDGQQIVFDRQWNDKSQDGLWIISKDGSESRRLVASEVARNGTRQSAWSPDGKTIAYEGPKENTQHYFFELWVVDSEGQSPKQLTHLQKDLTVWTPTWSPDGQQIVFTVEPGGAGGEADIYTINASGGEPRQLTFEGYTNLDSLWLPLDAEEILTGGDTPLQAPPTPKPVAAAKPKPKPAAPANCPNPGVQITSPAEGSTFTERRIFIIGNTNIPRFHHWRLEYSTVNDGHTWNYLFERDYPANNDKLAMIDTSTVPDGPYGLRLTVVDETGNYPEPCEVWFTNGY